MFVWFLLQFLLCEIWRGFNFFKGFVCLAFASVSITRNLERRLGEQQKGGKERRKERGKRAFFKCRICRWLILADAATRRSQRRKRTRICSECPQGLSLQHLYVPTYVIPTPTSTLVTYIFFSFFSFIYYPYYIQGYIKRIL